MEDLLWLIGLILFFNFASWLKRLFGGGNIPTQETGEYPEAGPHPFKPAAERMDEPAAREILAKSWREAENAPPSGLPPWLVLEGFGEEDQDPRQPSRQLPRRRGRSLEPAEQQPAARGVLVSTPYPEAGDFKLADRGDLGPDPLEPARAEWSETGISQPKLKNADRGLKAVQAAAPKRSLLDLGPESVARGIIWSEILQSPRCRRPFQWTRTKN